MEAAGSIKYQTNGQFILPEFREGFKLYRILKPKGLKPMGIKSETETNQAETIGTEPLGDKFLGSETLGAEISWS